MLTAGPLVQSDEFCFDTLLSMEADAFSDMMEVDAFSDIMAFVKPPNFFEMDFTMEPDWSEQSYSPDHSVFSSPGQYPQMVNGVPEEELQLLLPESAFGIHSPNYVSNHKFY